MLSLAALVAGALVAGCGGSHPSAATIAKTARPASAAKPAATGPLAFAECMRANGVPNFPDPQPGGGEVFSAGSGIDPAAPAFRAAQAKCQKLVDRNAVGGPLNFGAHTHPSPQTLSKLVHIARCMRQYGISQFPDPTTSIPSNPSASGISQITDFDGVVLLFPSTMNLQAPAYRQALAACGAPPLGLPH